MNPEEAVSNEERDETFKKLYKIADNKQCFDCGQKKPIWASSTFGVFICLDCAGGQRRLGTHITFVRACNMDTWKRRELETMKAGGNREAREFFRANGVRDLHVRQDTKYSSSTARLYRSKLARKVEEALKNGAAAAAAPKPPTPKKSFFEEFEPAAMPSRTQSAPELSPKAPAAPAPASEAPTPSASPEHAP
eukprot:CAMPEP_0119270456 /NCGR_PEP_ID=MMETSP1329-20130426/7452_1 /TAXON_ID=114041 /ORGANISM="Genus nov. species nov., Strain RCC1024" /LENGTH=192 /DNA_ID=CAMNT_0007270479 /DNA_START=186 /DNA_END=761 /DNA_ORIENTATION=+